VVNTGKWTARAANDKFIVDEELTRDKIWWGVIYRPVTQENFNSCSLACWHIGRAKSSFVQDCYVGADPNYRMPIRIVTEYAWQSLFARNSLFRSKIAML
jgi:phosphoenolpyruvate carboxykinase (ATP)